MLTESTSTFVFEHSFNKLEKFIHNQKYKGWDPYDGLNSKVFQALPVIRTNKLCRLIWIQIFKNNPFNLRKIFLVEKGFNSKGIALILHAKCFLYKVTKEIKYLVQIDELAELLLSLKSKGYSGDCWGYNFDWQARAFFQPSNTPTVVASVYAASALADAYEITKNEKYLKSIISCGDFILKDLNRAYDKDGNFCFSYSPLDKSKVFNASLLGSKLLALLFKYTGNIHYKEIAKKSVHYCCEKQNSDGSWVYGEQPFHQWIDNFHTGFNLECISVYQSATGDTDYQKNIDIGFNYYINTFFTANGLSKYYNNRTYPIDIHAPAQLVVTLFHLNKMSEYSDICIKVLRWTIDNMQDSKGYFYYQKNKYISKKIPYMRWAQSWMYYSLSIYKYFDHAN